MDLVEYNGTLKYTKSDLNLKITLNSGQAFRWYETDIDKYCGVIEDKIVVFNQTSKDQINYTVYIDSKTPKARDLHETKIEQKLISYFQFDFNLKELYERWAMIDDVFKNRLAKNANLTGIRLLRQYPVENIFSFICSSNNNIKRIKKMIANLCENFGTLIGTVDGTDHYTFPTINRLAQNDVEEKLRKLNFGYRAKFIHQAAVYLQKAYETDESLFSLRQKPYVEVHEELLSIPGVGRKVSDCICLMSLDKYEAVPLDVHMLRIAKNFYNFSESSKNKTLTKKTYIETGNKFRDLWGEYAGWTQLVMFVDDLKDISTKSP